MWAVASIQNCKCRYLVVRSCFSAWWGFVSLYLSCTILFHGCFLLFFSFPHPFSISGKTNSNYRQLEHCRANTEMAADCELLWKPFHFVLRDLLGAYHLCGTDGWVSEWLTAGNFAQNLTFAMGFVHFNSNLLLIFGVSGTNIKCVTQVLHQNLCCAGVCGSWLNFLVCSTGGFVFSCWKSRVQMSQNKHLTFGQLQPPASPVPRRCWEPSCGCAAAG